MRRSLDEDQRLRSTFDDRLQHVRGQSIPSALSPTNEDLGTGACGARLGVSCRVGLEPRARIGMRLAAAMRLATWSSHDQEILGAGVRASIRSHTIEEI